MTTINLYQNQKDGDKRPGLKGINSGFFFSLGILIITLLVLLGLKIYIPIVEGQTESLSANIEAENSKLVGLKNLEQIIDMQKRVAEIKTNLQIKDGKIERTKITEVLEKLGSEMTSGVVVSNFNYSAEKITVIFDANNFNDAAKQIASLKKSDSFTGINLASITRGERQVSFTINMAMKK